MLAQRVRGAVLGLALLGLLASAGSLVAASRAAGEPLVSAPMVFSSLANDVSPPLNTLGATQPAPVSGIGATGRGSILGPVESFEGIANHDNAGGAADSPPDTNGAAGPHDYVQWVNYSLAVYDKEGTRELGPIPGSRIWSGFGGLCESRNRGDPVVRYDQLAGRWVLTQLTGPGSGEDISAPHLQCFAVSTGPDPLGTYYRYAFEIPGGFNDYVKIAVWPDAYYMTDDRYGEDVGALGSGAFALDRAAMLAGRPATFVYFELGLPLFGILPSDLDGTTMAPAGTPDVFVKIDDHRCSSDPNAQDQLELWSLSVDFRNPGSATFTPAKVLPVDPFDSTFCGNHLLVPQPDPGETLDLLTGRMLFRATVREFGSYRSLVAMHAAVGSDRRAGLRWYEIRYSGQPASATIFQQHTYFGPDGDVGSRWAGSAAQDRIGDIALGFSVVSPTLMPSIGYAGRTPTDTLDTMPSEGRLVTGGGVQTDNGQRWGDYSSLTLDPVDDCTFWYTQEYYPVTDKRDWHTRIGSFRFPDCGAVPTISPGNVEGQTLTASPGSWPTLPGASFSYQWRRCNAPGESCTDISGATSRAYTIGTADVDGTLRVLARASNGSAEASALSKPTGVIAPTPAAGPLELSASIAAKPTSLPPGGQVIYTVKVGNASLTGSATGVVLGVRLPAGAELVSSVADRGPGCTGTTDLTCSLTFIPGGRIATVTVAALLKDRGAQTAFATVTADQAPTDPATVQSSVTVNVIGKPTVVVTAPLHTVRAAHAVTVSGTLSLDEPATVRVRALDTHGHPLILQAGSAAGKTILRRPGTSITTRSAGGSLRLSLRLAPGTKRGRLVVRATDGDGQTTTLSLPFGP